MMLSVTALCVALLALCVSLSTTVAVVFPQAVPPVSGSTLREDVVGPVAQENVVRELEIGMFDEMIAEMDEMTASPMPTVTPEEEYLEETDRTILEDFPTFTPMEETMGPSPEDY
eukprot:TRINITY_DN8315_c0_g1_i1.p2 TRINITY_DN8315_c0_g1~~TRINITY_DN8315_c0_g1_i1.p2  ORF type:complete len:115 (-),score=20.82 TRINITY_DN8315_c0_g1_i1:485-829(-)